MPDSPPPPPPPDDPSDATERRKSSRIPDDVSEDIPFGGPPDARAVPMQDPAGEHRRGMDKVKLTFSISLITGCLVVYVGLSILQYWMQARFTDAAPLTSAMDLLKLIATTALGFVFARTIENDNKG